MATKQESREVRFNEVFALRMPAELVARLEAAAERQYETASSLTRRRAFRNPLNFGVG